MKLKEIFKLIRFAGLQAFCFSLFCLAASAQSAGDIVIAEVAADPPGATITTAEPHGEYVVLCNRTTTAYNLSGFTLVDNSGSVTLPAYNLAGNSCVVVIAQAGATNVFGAAPGGYGCTAGSTNRIVIPTASWFPNQLSNTADRVGLLNGATLIDGVSYGGDVTYLSPSAPDAFNNTGQTLVRNGYPAGAPTALPDTNTSADFTTRSGTPCDSPAAPTSAGAWLGGQVKTAEGRGISGVTLTVTGGNLSESLTVRTSPFGYYRFEDLQVGQTYVITVQSKTHTFAEPTRVITLQDNLEDADFVGSSNQ